MDKPSPISTDLLISYEALRARLEIRDFFLRNIFREVYENIGQMLSLAKMQLYSTGATHIKEHSDIKRHSDPNESAGELVGQSIAGLREMCRDFYPDTEVLQENGFVQGIRKIMKIVDPGAEYLLKINPMNKEMESGIKLIVFNMLLEILVCLKKAQGTLISLAMGYRKEEMALRLVYTGGATWMDDHLVQVGDRLTLKQRAQLLHGSLVLATQTRNSSQLKLILPLNHHQHE